MLGLGGLTYDRTSCLLVTWALAGDAWSISVSTHTKCSSCSSLSFFLSLSFDVRLKPSGSWESNQLFDGGECADLTLSILFTLSLSLFLSIHPRSIPSVVPCILQPCLSPSPVFLVPAVDPSTHFYPPPPHLAATAEMPSSSTSRQLLYDCYFCYSFKYLAFY